MSSTRKPEFKPAWTPGPWTCDENGVVWGVESRERYGHGPSIDIFDASEWPAELADEAMANAKLIAAAQNLYFALAGVVPEMRRSHDAGDGHFSTEQVEKAEKALAEAHGEV
jgi:hypothetical protein